jgi:hypothetical protein
VVEPAAAVVSALATVSSVLTVGGSSSSLPLAFTAKPTTRPSATPPVIELANHLRG